MNRQRSIATWGMAFVALMAMMAAARGTDESALTAQGEKIVAEYTTMLEYLKKEAVSLAPAVDENVKADFAKQVGALNDVEPVIMRIMANDVTVKYGPGNPAFAEKQKEVLAAARAVLKKADVALSHEAYAKMTHFTIY